MKHLQTLLGLIFLLALPLVSVQAQTPAGAAGRWVGSIDVGGGKLGFMVNLTQKSATEWTGTISIPAQGMKDAAISQVTVKGEQLSFVLPEVPGKPAFTGKLSTDSQTITGELAQGGQTFPFQLAREGKETSSETPAKGVPGTGIAGKWQGTLDAGGATLRLVFKVTKTAEENFTVMLDSLDQNVSDIKADSATTKDKLLHCEWKRLGAVYEGKLSEDGAELTGEFQQGGMSFPLTLKRLKS